MQILPIRGNVDTRIRKAAIVEQGDYDAVVLASAGLRRLGLQSHITEVLPFDIMLPAPGQGALAVQCRAVDTGVRELLEKIDDPPTRAAVTAERCFLNALGGGCLAPIAAYAQLLDERPGWLTLAGLVAAADGSKVIRVNGQGSDPEQLGSELAQQALKQGAGALL
ncbi:MAG TPA: hypothetical protein VGK87_02365 [Anaerolineae bacterium]